jgi:galactosamine-6-phosphate isomerase
MSLLPPTIFPDHEQMSIAAANWLLNRLGRKQKDSTLVCLATGATPMRAYELLAQESKSVFQTVEILKLDEWGGVPMSHPATCETFLRKTLVEPLGLESRYMGFNSEAMDLPSEILRVRSWLESRGVIDYCVLGLGINGHIGFNEPADFLTPHAHIATLSRESLGHSMVAALEKKPAYGLTLGVGEIMASRQILLVVSGASKAAPLQRLLSPKISTHFPASLLHLHPRVTILCDRAAANEIS